MLIWMIVAFVFILGPLLFIHELGHFWAAKRFGIPIEEFGFGLGPKVATLFERNGTQYTIRAIPFAAFVLPAGEQDASLDTGLMQAPRRARFGVAVAGPLMNIVFTLVLFWVAYLFGPPAYTQVAITAVVPNSPAQAAGLQANDLVLQADQVEISFSAELANYTTAHLGKTITLLVEREGQQFNLQVTPREWGQYDPAVEGPMGITMRQKAGPPAPQGVFEAGRNALKNFSQQIMALINFPNTVAHALQVRAQRGDSQAPIAPEEDLRYLRPLGIYGILQLVAFSIKSGVQHGYWIEVFTMAGAISLGLGVFNLLPLPALDGGRMLFVVLDWLSEKLLRRRINPEKEVLIHAAGLMVLLLLMVVITWQDIVNPLFHFPPVTPTPTP